LQPNHFRTTTTKRDKHGDYRKGCIYKTELRVYACNAWKKAMASGILKQVNHGTARESPF